MWFNEKSSKHFKFSFIIVLSKIIDNCFHRWFNPYPIVYPRKDWPFIQKDSLLFTVAPESMANCSTINPPAEHFRLFYKYLVKMHMNTMYFKTYSTPLCIRLPRKDWPFNQKDWPFYLQWPPNPWQIAAPSIPRLNISDFRVSPDLTAAWSNFSRSQSEKTTAGPSFITPPPPLTSSLRSWTLKTSALACLTLPL